MSGFTPLLRLAWRDLRRNKGRSLVVFLMILLPVLGVSGASTVIATASVSAAEVTPRVMGTADVSVAVNGNAGSGEDSDRPDVRRALTALEPHVRSVLGEGTRTAREVTGTLRASTDKGATRVRVTESDLRSPLLQGTFRIVDGRLPRSTEEVAVNRLLADVGPGIGDELEVRDGPTRRVVGVLQDLATGEARAWGMPGSLIADPTAVGSVDEVRVFASSPTSVAYGTPAADKARVALANGGSEVTNRQDAGGMYGDGSFRGISGPDLAIFVLVVVMAVTEVVLLAGPAFAVTARRRQRELALLAANGGTPRQVRAAVLASAFVIGGLAALLGAAGGVLGGWAASPVVEGLQSTWFGPRDWSPWQVAGVAAFGLLSAVLAALVPAWIASRQDVVRVLTGRRGDPAPTRFSPLLGVLLMALGVGLTAIGVTSGLNGVIWIGFGAVFTVLGAVALMPMILAGIARLLARSPLVVRYALRDGLRHRTRTVPAIGAVMATVAGVVALGIANTSQASAGEKTYEPQLPMGTAVVRVWDDNSYGDAPRRWAAIAPKIQRLAPDAVFVHGFLDERGQAIGLRAGGDELYGDFYGPANNGVVVASSVPDLPFGLSAAEHKQANAILARGGAVVIGKVANPLDRVTLARSVADPDDPEGKLVPKQDVTVPAVAFAVKGRPMATAIVADRAAKRLGAEVGIAGALINRPVSADEASTLQQAVLDVAEGEVYVERGWQPDPAYALVMLVLMVVGTLLMVGGTVTATVLALADAGPDLATLSAVGAAPRTSRAVAMGIAFVIGGIGAALGVVVGAVPGVAATWPMTATSFSYGPGTYRGGTHTVDVPWLLLAEIAVGVPVLLALVVGLCARSRLPLVARVD